MYHLYFMLSAFSIRKIDLKKKWMSYLEQKNNKIRN